MKNISAGFAHVLLVILIIVLISFIVAGNMIINKNNATETTATPLPTPNSTVEPATQEADLSYINLYYDFSFTGKLFDSNGNEIKNITEPELPLIDPDSKSASGESLWGILYPKPDSGKYELEITGTGNYQLDAYLYDKDANNKAVTFKNSLKENESHRYEIIFDKKSSNNSSIRQL